METSLFLFLVALAFHARCSGRAVLTGAALGLALWVRPDALMLVAVFAVDAGLARVTPVAAASPEAPSSRERAAGQASAAAAARAADAAPGGVANGAWRAALVFLALAVAYGAFNLAVGGRLLPDTFAAKTAFYAGRSRWGFLTGDVAECFGTGAWLLLAPFALGALAREVRSLARRAPGVLRLEAGWVVALPLAYLVLLPYAHRFMRYLVPALPALAVLGLAGVQAAWRSRALRSWIGSPAARRAALAGVAVLAAALHARAAADSDGFYLYACRYHAERNERAGRWLAANTPADAVVATHDVGAIAYESRRRIVDTVGLVSPEVIPWVGRAGYERRLEDLFARRGVTFVAAFDEWLAVDNVAPLFTATPEPEVMRVFPWIPGRAHLVPEAVARAQVRARSALDRGDAGAALAELRIALELDRESAGAWTLLAQALARLGRRPEAEQAVHRALALFPDSPAARAVLAALGPATRRSD